MEDYGNPREAVLIGYLAGILDGEGCIRIGKTNSAAHRKTHKTINPTYLAYVQIGMVDCRIPDMFSLRYGGIVREERVPDRRSVWRWTRSGRESLLPILEEMLPHIIIKHEQAEVVLQFIRDWKTPVSRMHGVDPEELRRREDAYQKMRKLNAVGAPATTERESTREGEATV